MPEFTPDQKRVIAHGAGNLLVSAAAGSGKTAVLVERILHLVRGGADIASFLVVTFTRAAADELRERLLLKLEAAAEENEALREQAERLPLASISTIHAFCLSLLTRYFEKAGVEPNLRTCSDAERIIFELRAMDAMLDEAYDDEEMLSRLEKMGGVEQVRLNVESLSRFLMCQPDPMGWLETYEKQYDQAADDLASAPWFLRARELEKRGMARVEARIRQALDFARTSYADDCRSMAALIEGDLADFLAWSQSGEGALRLKTWRAPNRKEAGSDALLTLRALREAYKKAADEAGGQRLQVTDWTREQYAEMSDTVHALAEITRRYLKEYARIKAEMGVVDYNDLEQMALKLTRDESVCEDLRQKYQYIFVDEYQDSSAVQETLLARVARGDNTFHVGDVKQSIYGFRQSDPSLFLGEQARYGRGEGGQLIALNRNFRSLPNVLHCTNRVFARCMTRESAGMDYDEAARLYPGRAAGAPEVPTIVQLIDKKGGAKEMADEESAETVRGEIEAVARLIRRLVGTPVTGSDGKMRPARYGDIVVLRRSVASLLPQYLEVFGRMGIPVYSSKGGSFYETLEISQVMDYLWAVHNPLEDGHLLGTLHGVGGFTAHEIAEIRLKGRQAAGETARLWDCLNAYVSQMDDPRLGEKAARFMQQLASLAQVAREEKIAVLCASVLEETGILSRFAALPRGAARVSNLRSLPVRAAEYDEAGLRLGDFLRRIASTGSRNREEDVPAFSENDDVVRIMTVHQSKGLQFPIVIGAGLGARFRISNDKDAEGYLTSRVWCEKDCGFAVEYYDPQAAAGDHTLMTRAIAALRRQESIAEEMRILYVLMTRAQERLVLVGEVSGLEKKLRAWAAPDGSEASCMLDWIMPAVLTHPDVRALRKELDIELEEQPDESRWELSCRMDVGEEQPPEEEEAEALTEGGGPDPEVLAQLEYTYPYPETQVRQKQSVTELAHGEEETFFVREKPAFLQKEKKLSGSARGSALHRFMEIVDFEKFTGQDRGAEIARQAEKAVQTARMTREQADAVIEGAGEIEGFLDSPVGRAIAQGAPVLREKPFELRLDEDGQLRLVQGVIDLIVLEEDGAVLVDYKTDHAGLDAESVRARHGKQVALYRLAARRAGLHVKKSVVYLFYTGNMVEIEEDREEETR